MALLSIGIEAHFLDRSNGPSLAHYKGKELSLIMIKRLENPGFTALFIVATVMALLCYPQTAQAVETSKDQPHSTEATEAKGADAEVIRSSFESLPVPVLSEVAKSLARSKTDLSKEDFAKIVDEALKKAEEKPSESSKEAAEKLKKAFEDQRTQLGAETGSEFGAAAAEELARRIKDKDEEKPSDETKPGDKPTQTAEKPKDEKKKEIDPFESLRKQIEDVAQKLEKEKEEALKKADKGRSLNPADLAKALGGGKGKGEGEGGGSGSGDPGGGSGGGSPSPQSSNDSGEEQPKPQENSSAGEKLRNLADLLSQSNSCLLYTSDAADE